MLSEVLNPPLVVHQQFDEVRRAALEGPRQQLQMISGSEGARRGARESDGLSGRGGPGAGIPAITTGDTWNVPRPRAGRSVSSTMCARRGDGVDGAGSRVAYCKSPSDLMSCPTMVTSSEPRGRRA